MNHIRVRLFLSLLMCCCLASAGERRALVIGIGTYEDPAWDRINGDKDVGVVVDLLRRNGYSCVTTLVGAQATKQAIVGQFETLARICGKGDTVCIHFSGHGQRMTDIDGDEDDGWDEAWIPYDACRAYCERDRGERHLCDDEIGELLTHIRKRIGEAGVLAVIVDACHSGDSTRNPGKDTGVTRGVYDNFIIPGNHGKRRRRKVEEDWLTLSACLDYQLNQEHPCGRGKLTTALCALWPELKGTDNETFLRTLASYYQRSDVKGKYPQSPALTGRTGKDRISSIFR